MPVEVPLRILGVEPVPLPRLTGHRCFACGTANPSGLGMRFSLEEGSVRGDVTLRGEHQGWVDIAHGGIVSTVLDEIMAWAVIAFRRALFVTRRMDVTYRRPVPLGVPLVARGGISDREHPHGVFAWGRIEDAEGRVLAEAKGDMVYVPVDKLGLDTADLQADMEALFAAMEEAVG